MTNLPLPNLDDRTYADLVEEARSQISTEYATWTDHNASDPGIILIELLAWLTELALYRVNQLPEQNTLVYLNLLQGGEKQRSNLPQEIRQTLTELRQRYRAVTPADFVALVQEWNQTAAAQTLGKVKRSHCLPQCNLERLDSSIENGARDDSRDDSAHISLIVLPDVSTDVTRPQPSPELLAALHAWFAPRQLLTVRHHIVAPAYVSIQPTAQLFLESGVDPARVWKRARAEIRDFFHPLASGQYWEGQGWPFGRSVYAADLYAILDRIPGVDYVEQVQLRAEAPAQDEIAIAPHQLISAELSDNCFTLMEQIGNEWRSI